jgi:NhaP-type Na+/H+ or K+/H+ antiporter
MQENNDNWKSKTYLSGVLGGALLGALAAYLYARAAEEDEDNGGKKPSLQTGQLLSLSLAILGLIRQFAEAGKPKKK